MTAAGYILASYGALSGLDKLFGGKSNMNIEEAALVTGNLLLKTAKYGAAAGTAAGAAIGAAKSEKTKRELGR